jgi:type I restriction enzyme M protein
MIETALPQEGRVAVVVPHGVLFRGGSRGPHPPALIEENLLDAVVGLPANLFPTTSIPVAILVFDRAREERRRPRRLPRCAVHRRQPRLPVAARTRTPCSTSTSTKVHRRNLPRARTVDKYAHVASLQEIADNDFNLNIPRYVDTFEEEEEIDVAAVEQEIERLEGELAEVRLRMKQYLKRCG